MELLDILEQVINLAEECFAALFADGMTDADREVCMNSYDKRFDTIVAPSPKGTEHVKHIWDDVFKTYNNEEETRCRYSSMRLGYAAMLMDLLLSCISKGKE